LENYVATEKHLPKIPSAMEMKEKGVNLSDFQMRLLEKVEELTLYIVQQEKTINLKDAKIATQDAEIAALNARLAAQDSQNSNLDARLAAVEQLLKKGTNNSDFQTCENWTSLLAPAVPY